jgi:hypothetical protein
LFPEACSLLLLLQGLCPRFSSHMLSPPGLPKSIALPSRGFHHDGLDRHWNREPWAWPHTGLDHFWGFHTLGF